VAKDGLDPKHLEINPRPSRKREVKPLPFDFRRRFAAQDTLKLFLSIEHELGISICNVKEDRIVLGLLQGSKIVFNGLGSIITGLGHGLDGAHMLVVQLDWCVYRSQVIQECPGREMGGEMATYLQRSKYSAAKTGL